MANKTKDEWIEKFDLKKIENDSKKMGKIMLNLWKEEFNILERILHIHSKLTGYFFRHSQIKLSLRLTYENNVVLNNSIFNHIYLFLSVFELMKKGYYGSTRIILRQSFEMLMIGKCCEYDKQLQKIWESNDAQMKNVWAYLKNKNKKYKQLKNLYQELCKFTHHTTFSQQAFRIPKDNKKELIGELTKSDYLENYLYTLDLLFVLENMLFHLSNMFHNKVRKWYFGYEKDPWGDFIKIRKLKKEYLELKKEYFNLMKKRKISSEGIKRWKKIIYEYRLNWG